jgi:hypothetical protein
MKKTVKLRTSKLPGAIKMVLNEKMGVPDNIYETAVQLYNQIIEYLSTSISPNTRINEIKFTLNGDYHISNYNFNFANFTITVITDNNDDYDYELVSTNTQLSHRIENWKFISTRKDLKVIDIDLILTAPEYWDVENIIKYLKKERWSIISTLTHELKHVYDDQVKLSVPIHYHSEYNTIQEIRLNNITPINRFLFYLYFIHELENLVRPSEFYALLKEKRITKSQFKSFFNESELIKKLKSIRDFKFNELFNELRDYIPFIEEFIDDVIEQNDNIPAPPNDISNDEKIDYFLKLFFMLLLSKKFDNYKEFITQNVNPLSILFGGDDFEQANKMMRKYFFHVKKFKNYRDFFGYEEKRLNLAADKMIRKLAKLYDMVEHDEKSSIVNWDLHHKINKTAEKTLKEIKNLAREGKLNFTVEKSPTKKSGKSTS